MKVTLFGGSFNPPHLGHALVIAEFLESAITDELWLLPTINHAFGKDLAPAQHRLAMAKLLINFINHDLGSKIYDLKLCPIEIDLNLSGQTYDTLHALKQNPDYLKEKMNLTDYQLPIPDRFRPARQFSKVGPLARTPVRNALLGLPQGQL